MWEIQRVVQYYIDTPLIKHFPLLISKVIFTNGGNIVINCLFSEWTPW